MDTYWSNSLECIGCGECVNVCPEKWLYMEKCKDVFDDVEEEFVYIGGGTDYTPCHHCDGFWGNRTPCQVVCPVNAIRIERR